MRCLRLLPELLLLPFIIHRLGESEYGIYILAWSVYAMLELIQSGISSALVKYSAEFFERNQMEDINKLLTSACVLTGSWGLAGGLLVIGAVNLFPGLLAMVNADAVSQLRFACNAIAVMMILIFPLMPFAGILYALQRYDLFAFINTLLVYLRVAGIIGWFLMVGPSLKALIIFTAASVLAANLIFLPLAFRKVPTLHIKISHFSFRHVKMLLKFGTMVLLTSLCILVNTSGVNWLMGILVSTSFVGVMAIILKPPQLMTEIIGAMSITVMPATSKYAALKDEKMLRELFVRGTRYMALVAALCWIVIFLMTRPVLKLWMGPEYAYLSPYGIILCSGTIFWMSGSCAFNMLRGMGMLRVSVISEFVGLVLVGFFSILLIFKITQSPFIAVAVGLSLGQTVGTTLRLIYCIRAVEAKPLHFFVQAYSHTLGVSLLITLLAAAVIYLGHVESFWGRASVTVVSLGGFCLLFMAVLNEGEKRMAKEFFRIAQIKISRLILHKP